VTEDEDDKNLVIVDDLRACMSAHNRKHVACALTSCRECSYAKGGSLYKASREVPKVAKDWRS
jgi:hypothetical protein